MMRLKVLFTGWLILLLLLPACTAASPQCERQDVFCVGLVTNIGGINDNSLNQSAWEGVLRSRRELGARVELIESVDSRDYEKNISVFTAEKYDVIVTVGFGTSNATIKAAGMYPNVDFIGVDQFQDEETPGVAGLIFPEDRGGFLVGALAAMMSATGRIGAVCGPDYISSYWQLGEGYKAGAAYADQTMGTATDVFIAYLEAGGGVSSDSEGANTARSMIEQGADTIFSCNSAPFDNGTLIAAARAGAYVIGADHDRYLSVPGAAPRMLTSVVKMAAPSVFELITLSQIDEFPSGNYFGEVGIASFHELENKVPSGVRTTLEEIEAGLSDGSIKTNVPPEKP
jgi:basic membrane protein A and related proteins